MPWLRAGDNAATHPRVMRLLSLGDERTLNEVFGFVVRCALQSAAHTTDYLLDEGTLNLLGGTRTPDLLALAKRTGLMAPEKRRPDGTKPWRLVADPEFLHMRLREEIEWERQRKADASNPELTVPVRLRDGDACRYCGNVVQWRARKGGRRGTYDHREPGRPAKVTTYVVACGSCNAARAADPKADERLPLLPPPTTPFYGEDTVALLAKHGHRVPLSTARPATPADTAPARPPRQGDTARSTTTTARPATHADTARSTTPARPPRQGDTARDTTPREPSTQPATAPARPATHADTARARPETDTATHDEHRSNPPPQDETTGQRRSRSADPADPRSTDRDGTGRTGTGASPTHGGAAPDLLAPARGPTRSRRRGRRGR
ncbi:hypothetical protein [Thalassiella azotivora]